MTAFQFRCLLTLFVIVLAAYLLYDPNRTANIKRFEWMLRLPAYQRYLLLAILLVEMAVGLVGLVGMFFFLRWAAIAFLVASATAEFTRPGRQNTVQKLLAYSVVTGEVLFLYLIFFGPAVPLFA